MNTDFMFKLTKIKNIISTTILLVFLLGLLSCSSDKDYKLNDKGSTVSFASIKKQYVVEAAVFNKLTGALSKDGKLSVEIFLDSIETGIPIRDQRLQQIFFVTSKHPSVTIASQINLKKIKAVKGSMRESLDFDLTLNGVTRKFTTEVIIRHLDGQIIATTIKPIVINANNFEIPADHLIELAKTVGSIPISPIVPVSFSIAFK